VLAKQGNAYLEGLLVIEPPQMQIAPRVAMRSEHVAEVVREWRRFADGAHAQFSRLIEAAHLPWGELNDADQACASWKELEGRTADVLGRYARLFDLIVVGRGGETWQDACETALFETGRPVLLAPATPPAEIGETVVIAWNGSPETARTVAMAGPFLAKAERVLVLSVEGWLEGEGSPGSELAAHLRRNGVQATAATIAAGERSVGAAILAECQGCNADLLIKGAYTRSRLRQVMFGGVTQHILEQAALPVFLAH
jgi:nucleotide-binding universal stress UspA family protein